MIENIFCYSAGVLRVLPSEMFGMGRVAFFSKLCRRILLGSSIWHPHVGFIDVVHMGRFRLLRFGLWKNTKRALQLSESDGEINRLGKVVVGPKIKRKLDILTCAFPAYHEDR